MRELSRKVGDIEIIEKYDDVEGMLERIMDQQDVILRIHETIVNTMANPFIIRRDIEEVE